MQEGEALLQALLEELLESGRSVESVCAAHPELIPEVRRRLALVRGVQAQMDALFPPHDGDATNGATGNGTGRDGTKPT
jgi:hypothetical protein